VPLLHGFLDILRDGLPAIPVVLATPIVCPALEEHPGPLVTGADGLHHTVARADELAIGSLTLTRVRELVASVVATRREGGDHSLHFVDGLALLGPDADGYRLMADRFFPLVFGKDGLVPLRASAEAP
jgi:hypothetical protein